MHRSTLQRRAHGAGPVLQMRADTADTDAFSSGPSADFHMSQIQFQPAGDATQPLAALPAAVPDASFAEGALAAPYVAASPAAPVQLQQGAPSTDFHLSHIATAPEAGAAPLPNTTGLPDGLKTGVEALSGVALDDVQVHYNSAKPDELDALAYAQGSEIHVGPGQEQHLPHEAWHVVQQKQGRVAPTIQAKGIAINDSAALEQEADLMGARALQAEPQAAAQLAAPVSQPGGGVIQAYSRGGAWKTSANGLYKTNGTNELRVQQGAAPPEPAGQFTLSHTVAGYDVYVFSGAFQNDCLDFAEYLSRGTYASQSAFRAQGDRPAGTDRLFGNTDATNINIAAGSFARDAEANPQVGQTYAIVRREIETTGVCPFHIAMVIATDGPDRITCEADAGTARTDPVFDMYTVPEMDEEGDWVQSGKTFHGSYEESYTTASGVGPSTGVLAPR